MQIQIDTITKEDVLLINSLVERGILRKIEVGGYECEIDYEPYGTTYSDGVSASEVSWKGCLFGCMIPIEVLND